MALAILALPARGDYVGSLVNRIFVDPVSVPVIQDGIQNGDEISYILETTPADTGSNFGHAAWMTVYIPAGAEVIGAEFVLPAGNGGYDPIPAEDTDDTYDGWGARGRKGYSPTTGATQLGNGYVNEVQQDSGIFFSTDPRTRVLVKTPIFADPTGVPGQDIYNIWDYDQTLAYGVRAALSGNGGTGNSPLLGTGCTGDNGVGCSWTGTGSIVAGSETYYTNDYLPIREFWTVTAAVGSDGEGSGTLVPKIIADDYVSSDPGGTARELDRDQYLEVRAWDTTATAAPTVVDVWAQLEKDRDESFSGSIAFQFNTGAGWSPDRCIQSVTVGVPAEDVIGYYSCDLENLGVDTAAELNALDVRVIARSGAVATDGFVVDHVTLRVEYPSTFIDQVTQVGPWQRITYENSKLGGSDSPSKCDPADEIAGTCPPAFLGDPTTIVPSYETGPIRNTSLLTGSGWDFGVQGALPAATNAVRFVHGARRLGELETARITLRVTDQVAFTDSYRNDTFCLDSTGGDTSDTAGKDVPWRYYEPQHECSFVGASGNLLKQIRYVNGELSNGASLSVGDIVGFEVTIINTSGGTLTDVILTDTPDTTNLDLLEPGADGLCPYASYDGDLPGPAYTAGTATAGTAEWATVAVLNAGESFTIGLCAKVVRGNLNDRLDNTATASFLLPDATPVVLTSTAGGTISTLISGHVYADPDASGDLTAGDAGVAGVTVELWQDTNSDGLPDVFVATTVTLSDGSYSFAGISAGNYVVLETNPAGWTSTGDTDAPLGTCGTNGCDVIGTITVSNGGASTGNDFFDEPPATDVNTISGTTFLDVDEDGLYEPSSGETGQGSVTVELYRDNDGDGTVSLGDTLLQTTVSAAGGSYLFTIVEEGDFVVATDTGSFPPGQNLTTDNIETATFIGFGNTDANNDFGLSGGVGTTGGVCYAVAGSVDQLVAYTITSASFTDIGPTGTINIEAIAYQFGTNILFAADSGTFGSLDQSTGAFTAIGAFGSCTLPDATVINVTDVDGLTFDPFTGILWGSHRDGDGTAPDDVLVRIDPATGQVAPDCVRIGTTAAVGLPDVDDIAISPVDQTMYAVANNGGAGDRLVIMDTATGAVTDVGETLVADIEGLGFDNDGTLYGTDGSSAPNGDLYTIDESTGVATAIVPSAFPVYGDYESVDCITAGANLILDGTVFADQNQNGVYEPGLGEVGQEDVTVFLYRDADNSGTVTAGDVLIQTTTTDANGDYTLALGTDGNFVITTDFPGSYPDGAVLTTDNFEEADFVGFNQSDEGNDFGFIIPGGLVLDKSSDGATGVVQGDLVTYTIVPRATTSDLLINVVVTDFVPTGTAFAAAVPAQTSGPNPVRWELGSNAPGAAGAVAGTTGSTSSIATSDSWISEDKPDENHGSHQDLHVREGTGNDRRTLVQWSPSIPAGSKVTSATLRFRVRNTSAFPVDVHPLTRSWDEGTANGNSPTDVDWIHWDEGGDTPPADEWATPGGDFGASLGSFTPSTAGTYVDFTNAAVTAMVQGWIDSPSANFGVVLIYSASAADAFFGSRGRAGEEPLLAIDYVTATTSTTLAGGPALVAAGDTITVTMTVESDLDDTNVTPGPLNVTGAAGAGAGCGLPNPSSQDLAAGVPATFTWTCVATAGSLGGSVTFDANASGDLASYARATSNSVLVSPLLTFQVTVDNPLDPDTGLISNTATMSSDLTTPASDTVLDPVVRGTIGDRIWLDTDGDGIQDIGEEGIANVEVSIYSVGGDGVPGGGDDVLVATTTTDANGKYLFNNLPPGTYYIDVTDSSVPAGLVLAPGSLDAPSEPIATLPTYTVTSSEVYLTADIGYTAAADSAVVGDYIWSDADQDGVQDPGEPGISGVTVNLVSAGSDGVFGTVDDVVEDTTTTAGDGSYLFSGVAAGEYIVGLEGSNFAPGGALEGYSATTGPQSQGSDTSDPLTVVDGDVYIDADFGYFQAGLGSIGSLVWLDADGDGTYDAGETGLEGVTIDLALDTNQDSVLDPDGADDIFGTADDEMVIATAVTSADGSYSFDGLLLDDGSGEVYYVVSVTDTGGVLTDMTHTTGLPRIDGESQVDPYVVELSPIDTVNITADFGYNGPASIGQTLWIDSDGDGIKDASEFGIEGVTVDLIGPGPDGTFGTADDEVLATATTDATGAYLFPGLVPGDYMVDVTDIGGVLSTLGLTLTTDPDGTLDAEYETTLVADASDLTANFGYQNAALPEVSGTVFEDDDMDGLQDAGESGFAGVTVALVDSNGVVVAVTTTDANGDYVFTDVPPGDYDVAVTDANGVVVGYTLTSGLDTRPVTVGTDPVTGIDFGYSQDPATASIGETIFFDADRDGLQDAGEGGISGVTVDLYDVGPDGAPGGGDDVLVASTTTDANGDYVFSDLQAGVYWVEVTDLGADGLPGTGDERLTGLFLTAGSNPTSAIALSEGEIYPDADFGYASAPATGSALGDTLFYDADADGFEDAGEVGIAGVTIRAWDPGGDGFLGGGDDVLLDTVVTDIDGTYLFVGLDPGKTYVEIDTSTLPTGYDTTPTNGPSTRPFDVVAGEDILHADFGFNGGTPGTVGDRVYLDEDGDGAQGAGEPGIGGVTVNLVDNATGRVVATMSTGNGMTDVNGDLVIDENDLGFYEFVGIQPGTYADLNPIQTPPAPFTITAAGESFDTADFGYAPSGGKGTIGGTVWHDTIRTDLLTENGVLNVGESGFEGVTVELWLDTNGNGIIEPGIDNLVRTETTDENGEYEFKTVPFGDYLVTVSDDFGVLAGFQSVLGPTPGADNNGQVDPYAVTIGSGQPRDFTADFAYEAIVPYSISGTTFFDANGNALFDEPGESGVGGVTVYLYRDMDGDGIIDPSDPLIGTTVSDSNGDYVFTDLPDGDYLIEFDPSATFLDGLTQTTQQTTPQIGIEPATIAGADVVDQDFGCWTPPTAVLVSSFSAEIGGGGVVVRWETASEVGTMGFYLYRWDGEADAYTLINEQLLPASMAAQGGVYELMDVGAGPGASLRYALVEVEAGGAERSYGPFDVVAERMRPALDNERRFQGRIRQARPSDRLFQVTLVDKRRGPREPGSSGPGLGEGTPAHGKPGRQGVSRLKLELSQEGLYRLTASEVSSATGVNAMKVKAAFDSGRVELSSAGTPVPWKADGDGIIFFGEAPESPYSAANVYWLDFGFGKTMAEGWGGTPSAATTTASQSIELYEENVFPVTVVARADADLYYWAHMSAGDPTWGSFASSLWVDNPRPGEAALTVLFQSTTSTPAANEHRVRLSLNGVDLGTTVWDGAAGQRGVFTVPAGVLENGTNHVEMTAELVPGVPYSVVLVDGFELEYPRLHRALGDRLLLATDSAAPVSVDGFSSSEIGVVDVTDPKSPRWLEGVTVTPDGAGYRATFVPAGAEHRYALAAMAAIATPVTKSRPAQPRGARSGAEYVVIAPEALRNGAQALADYRTAMGLSTLVVELETVYDEFSHGLENPEAIRAFLSEAWQNWPIRPRFAVLAGDGTFDYLDHQGLGDNLVPPLLVSTPQGMFASDVMLGDVVGEDLIPEIAVGRIPVLSNEELETYVTKLSLNETAGIGSLDRLTMLSDDADGAGNFPADSDRLLLIVPEAVTSKSIYLSHQDIGSARAATFGAFAAGTEWVNYLGHGGTDRFANEGLLTATDVSALSVGDRLPVVSSLTCSAGRFEVPGWESLAEALVLEPDGGAAVVWAPSGQSYHFEAMALNEALFRAIFAGTGSSVGEIVLEALETHQPKAGFEYLPTVYNLIGDPAYRVR
jgi:uncharacterized repeat protein (TIGR01451 family)